jgi:hypothetical protein
MTLRGDDAIAMREASLKVERSGLGLQVKNATHRDTNDTSDFKARMLLTFAETKEHNLEVAYSREHERAESEKLRADQAEQAYSEEHDRAESEKQRADRAEKAHSKDVERVEFEKLRADKAEQAARIATEKMHTANEKTSETLTDYQGILSMLKQSRTCTEQATMRADRLQGELDNARGDIHNLKADLEGASNPRASIDQAMISQLQATITTRDNMVKQLQEKQNELTEERLNAIAQIAQNSGQIQLLEGKNDIKDARIKDLMSKLAKLEADYDK